MKRSQNAAAVLPHRLCNPLARAWRTAARWFERRAAAKALAQLEDYMLKDIGLSRCEIEMAVCGRHRHSRLMVMRESAPLNGAA